jgi:hypothetical protein
MASYYDLALAELNPGDAVLLAQEEHLAGVALETTLADCQLKPLPALAQPGPLPVLRRVTLEISDPKHFMQLSMNSAVPEGIDLLAVRPLTEKVFLSVCKDYPQFDIIRFEAMERIPFMLRRNQVQDALRNGLFF